MILTKRARRILLLFSLMGSFLFMVFLNREASSPIHREMMEKYKYYEKLALKTVERLNYTLEEARAEYVVRHNRQPPENYDKWFQFAKEHKCYIHNCNHNID
jgi:hypothetical protein